MIKILWADDQTDVVNTFSAVLEPLSAKITFVRDGNEAVEKLKTKYFDILILDLKMLPDEWGGLWVLEELRKFNKKIPVIVLSGEGTQTETIKALRLGAQDYVTKDKLQTDLLQRVEMVLQDSDRKTIDDLTNYFPTLISMPYKRYLNTLEPTTRLHRLLEFFEAYLRFCCIVGICEMQPTEALKNNESGNFKSLIQSPSMGIWNQSRYLLAKYLSRDTVFALLNNSVDNEFAATLVKIRNDLAHGAEPSEALATQYLIESEGNLYDFAKRLWQSMDVELVLPTKFQFDGTKFEVDGVMILGSNTTLPKTSFSTTTPLISSQPYLTKKTLSLWVNLFPFIILEPSTEPASWKIMVFDGLKMDRNAKNINGEENIKYIDISSGQRNFVPISKPVSKMLPNFVIVL